MSDVLLKIFVFRQHGFADDVVEVYAIGWWEIACRFAFVQPRQLQRFLVIFIVQIGGGIDTGDFAAGATIHFVDGQIAPVNERRIFALFQRVRIVTINQNSWSNPDGFLADIGILWMRRHLQFLGLGNATDIDDNRIVESQRCVSWGNGIDYLLIECPDFVPFHEHNRFAAALRDDELFQAFDSHAPTQDTTNGREPRIVPAIHQFILDEPSEFAFRQHCVGHVQPTVLPDVWPAQIQCFDEPIELGVAIVVLHCAQRVRHAFDGIDNWTSEIVCWVNSVASGRKEINE